MLIEGVPERLILPFADPRAKHVRELLRMGPGDRFDVGSIGGPRGKALIAADSASGMELQLEWGALPRPALPLSLIVGLSRPQTMRKILREAPALGIAALHLPRCARSEAGYSSSSLWSGSEWRDLLHAGTEQAFTTRVPELKLHDNLAEALAAVGSATERIALDNYEASLPLARWKPSAHPVSCLLCVGPERGWDGPERVQLRENGCQLAHLGPLVLRTETAMIAGSALVASSLGYLDDMKD